MEAEDPKIIRLLAVALVAWFSLSPALAEEAASPDKESPARRDYRGFAFVGAFFVTNIDSRLGVFLQDFPIGTRIDISKELELGETLAVPRLSVGWRFGRRHVLGFGWYDVSREGDRTFSPGFEPPEPLPPGVEIHSFIKTEIYRLSYTWMFHTDEKVKLGFGGGLFIGDLGAGIKVFPEETRERFEDRSFTAPLPVIGGRLSYRATARFSVLLNTDFFFLNYDIYKGTLLDLELFANHQTFKNVGFGIGINLQGLNVEIDDEELFWQVDSSFIGVLALLGFRF